MLCHTCQRFLTDVVNQDLTTWRRIKDVEEKWFTFKLGNHATTTAAAEAGCDLCALFNQVRAVCIPNYDGLGEKWHAQAASIDVKHGRNSENGSKWTFQLLTVAPEMSWIPFEVFRPDLEEDAVDHGDINMSEWPREISESATSSNSIGIARQWVQDCLLTHPKCARPDDSPLPTRVLDLGILDETSDPRLFVANGQSGQYVTLSHCWGTGYRVTLTKNNLHKFKQAISLKRLPKTFQDAIQMTRLLGVRYLWIDALCIVQDDQNDWRRESASMCSVFENAMFSLSAVAASDSHTGILHSRVPHHAKIELNGTHVGVRQKLDSLTEAMMKSKLETRAWCYQERLLPKAILHVAPNQMYWECRTCIVSETCPRDNSLGGDSSRAKDNLAEGSANSDSFRTSWRRLVSIYSGRQVTRASDRLPAIAGLADRVKKEITDSTYLQGLWSHDLHAGLLWKRKLIAYGKLIPSRDKYFARSSTSSGQRPRRPIARSWSWASTNDAVEYAIAEPYTERSITKFDARFLIPESSEDEEFALPNMVLPLEAHVKRGTCRLLSAGAGSPDEASFRPSGSLLVDDGLGCSLDYIDDAVSKSCYCIRIASWKQPSVKLRKKTDEELYRTFYLLLERVQDKMGDDPDGDSFGLFRRIGMGFDSPRKVDKIFAHAERRHLRLI